MPESPPYSPRPGDLPLPQIVVMMSEALAKNPNTKVYVKWTCPQCGERCISGTPNTVHTSYMHEDCGAIYEGQLYGMMLHLVGGGE